VSTDVVFSHAQLSQHTPTSLWTLFQSRMSFGAATRNRVRQYSCAHSNSVWFRCRIAASIRLSSSRWGISANDYAAGQLKGESQLL
jgi:hypothetical protein